jgi:uncharacterized protein
MTSKKTISDFLAHKNLALIRASRSTPVRGFKIDKELKARGYTVSVVYLDENAPGKKLGDLKDPVGGVIIAVPAGQMEQAVRQAIEAKISQVWVQKGCESKSAVALCEEKGLVVIPGECIMMFAEPVKSFHAFHRGILKFFGKLPQ